MSAAFACICTRRIRARVNLTKTSAWLSPITKYLKWIFRPNADLERDDILMAHKAASTAEISFEILAMQIADFEEVEKLGRNTEGIGLNESDTLSNIALYLELNTRMSYVTRHNSELEGTVLCIHDVRHGYMPQLSL